MKKKEEQKQSQAPVDPSTSSWFDGSWGTASSSSSESSSVASPSGWFSSLPSMSWSRVNQEVQVINKSSESSKLPLGAVSPLTNQNAVAPSVLTSEITTTTTTTSLAANIVVGAVSGVGIAGGATLITASTPVIVGVAVVGAIGSGLFYGLRSVVDSLPTTVETTVNPNQQHEDMLAEMGARKLAKEAGKKEISNGASSSQEEFTTTYSIFSELQLDYTPSKQTEYSSELIEIIGKIRSSNTFGSTDNDSNNDDGFVA